MLLLSLLLLINAVGCASPRIVLNPIEDKHIQAMTAGVSYTPKLDGWFLSDRYVQEIADVDIE